jgi:Ca2+/H+ antiporter
MVIIVAYAIMPLRQLYNSKKHCESNQTKNFQQMREETGLINKNSLESKLIILFYIY